MGPAGDDPLSFRWYQPDRGGQDDGGSASARARGIRRLTVEANDHALRFDERVGLVTHGVAETPFGSASSMAYELVPGVPRGS